MAEKRSTGRKRRRGTPGVPKQNSEQLKAAAANVERARESLRQAETAYQQAEADANHPSDGEPDLTVGRVLDGVLGFVRRFPGAGVIAAGTIGFLLGRTTRRR